MVCSRKLWLLWRTSINALLYSYKRGDDRCNIDFWADTAKIKIKLYRYGLINSEGDDILTKTRKNGDTVYYNKATSEFAVKTKDGFLRTFFKPKGGIEYFNRQ